MFMKTPIILGLIVLSSLALASCSDTSQKSPTAANPAPVSPNTPVPKSNPTPTPDTSMTGMDHSKMDM